MAKILIAPSIPSTSDKEKLKPWKPSSLPFPPIAVVTGSVTFAPSPCTRGAPSNGAAWIRYSRKPGSSRNIPISRATSWTWAARRLTCMVLSARESSGRELARTGAVSIQKYAHHCGRTTGIISSCCEISGASMVSKRYLLLREYAMTSC